MTARELEFRRLRYRLRRQGMNELDLWLAPLEAPLIRGEVPAVDVAALLDREPPELQAMMAGLRPLPESLRPWLGR